MNAFETGVTIMSVAGAVCHWYWTLHRETEREKGAFKKALRGSVWRTLRYHAGTVAFGALVIAIVQFVRACLAYLDKQTQGLQKKNAAMRLMFKVIQCCLPVNVSRSTFTHLEWGHRPSQALNSADQTLAPLY